jgi:hypothetical protein
VELDGDHSRSDPFAGVSPQGIHFLFSPRPADYSPAHPRIQYEK